MPPKAKGKAKASAKRTAKAKEAARRTLKNSRRGQRRECVEELLALATKVGADSLKLSKRTASTDDFDKAVRLLEKRCQDSVTHATLRELTEKWTANGYPWR